VVSWLWCEFQGIAYTSPGNGGMIQVWTEATSTWNSQYDMMWSIVGHPFSLSLVFLHMKT